VHDVGRLLELQPFNGTNPAPGLWIMGPGNVHPAGGEAIATTFNPRTVVASAAAAAQPTEDFDVWWLDAYCWSDTDNIITSANLVAFLPALPGQTIVTGMTLAAYNNRMAIADASGAGLDDSGQSTFTNLARGPLLLPFGTTLNARTVAVAATPGTIFVNSRIWIGPRGTRPPGLA